GGIVSTLGVAAGRLFCGGTGCAAAAAAMHEETRKTAAGRRIFCKTPYLQGIGAALPTLSCSRQCVAWPHSQSAAGTLSKFRALSALIHPPGLLARVMIDRRLLLASAALVFPFA